MYKPPWFETTVQFQPLDPPKAEGKIRELVYPEDRLLEKLSRLHPELWSKTIINMVREFHVCIFSVTDGLHSYPISTATSTTNTQPPCL